MHSKPKRAIEVLEKGVKNLLELPVEIHLKITDEDVGVYHKWPRLCKYTATTSRYNENLDKHRTWKIWFKNGQLCRLRKYDNGSLVEHKCFYNNGNLMTHCKYSDGSLDGDFIHCYENGQKQAHYIYKSGDYHGEYKEWHKDGKQSVLRVYENGVEQGNPQYTVD